MWLRSVLSDMLSLCTIPSLSSPKASTCKIVGSLDARRERNWLLANILVSWSHTNRHPKGGDKILNKVSDLGGRGAEEEPYDPISRNPRTVLGTLQLGEVDSPPEQGGRKPREAHAHDLIDGEAAPQLH
jgi:hypothetical protein